MMKLFENLKSSLGEDTVAELAKTFNEAVEDGIKIKLGDRIKQLEEKSEQFVEKKVSSLLEAKEKELISEYEEKYNSYRSEIEGHLDAFLESAIVDTISESVIEDVAKLQMFSPIVTDIMESFQKHYTPIAPKDADTALADAMKESADLKKIVEKTLTENKKLVTMAERAAVRVLFTEKTQNLTKKQKLKIWEMVKDFDFDTAERKIGGMVSLIEEFSADDNDPSIGGSAGSDDGIGSTDDDLDGVGDEDEVTVTIDINKESWDAMVSVEVTDEENPPKSKALVDFLTPYMVEAEGGDGEFGESDEGLGDEGLGDEGMGVEEPAIVSFEVPESRIEELKAMFSEGDYGDIADDVREAIDMVISDGEGDDDGIGDEGSDLPPVDDVPTESAKRKPVKSALTEWASKWQK
jgi:hypothetical protein